jgi:hypothetical protein
MLQGHEAFGGYYADRDDGFACGIRAWRPRSDGCVCLCPAQAALDNIAIISVPGELVRHALVEYLSAKDTSDRRAATS